jgi:acyl transferase domain-containing protein
MQTQLQSFFERRVDALNDEDIKNIAYTLGARRTNFAWRSFVTFSGIDQLHQKLAQTLPRAKSSQGRNVAFVFTGQGAQYVGMGKELMVYPVFQESLRVCQKLLGSMGADPRLIDAMFATEGPDRVNEPQYSQPLCTALQIALVDLMEAFGIRPKTVVGHSSGEIAAA